MHDARRPLGFVSGDKPFRASAADEGIGGIQGRCVRVRERLVIEQCVEVGVMRGIARAFRHAETPSREDLEREAIRATLEEIGEWFEFSEDAPL